MSLGYSVVVAIAWIPTPQMIFPSFDASVRSYARVIGQVKSSFNTPVMHETKRARNKKGHMPVCLRLVPPAIEPVGLCAGSTHMCIARSQAVV